MDTGGYNRLYQVARNLSPNLNYLLIYLSTMIIAISYICYFLYLLIHILYIIYVIFYINYSTYML